MLKKKRFEPVQKKEKETEWEPNMMIVKMTNATQVISRTNKKNETQLHA